MIVIKAIEDVCSDGFIASANLDREAEQVLDVVGLLLLLLLG